MTSTGDAVGMEGRASGPECTQNSPYPERETGGLADLLEATAIQRGPDSLRIRQQASSTIRAQAAELERLRGALESILDVSQRMNPDQSFNAQGRLARCAEHAARALKTQAPEPNTSEQST